MLECLVSSGNADVAQGEVDCLGVLVYTGWAMCRFFRVAINGKSAMTPWLVH